jgi:ankyrin repeat protein
MVAARSGSIACVYVLLDHLADVDLDRGDEDGMTAALHAAQGRYTEIYACLDARRRDPDRADSQGRTALFWACRNRDAVLRDYLVDVAGASFEYAALLHRDVDPDWVAQAQGPRPPRERTGVLRA